VDGYSYKSSNDFNKGEQAMKTLYIDRERFIQGYFSDKDDYRHLANRVVGELRSYGESKITVRGLLEESELTNPYCIKNWDITGYPSDVYIEDAIEDGIIPKTFWDEYELQLEEK